MKKEELLGGNSPIRLKLFLLGTLFLSWGISIEAQTNKINKPKNPSPLNSQEIIAPAGGISKFSEIELEWTLGESFIGEANGSKRVYTIGFHQPHLNIQPELMLDEGSSDEINIYPNPVGNKLNVKFQLENAEETGGFKFILTDLLGKQIFEKSLDSSTENPEVYLPEMASGSYQIKIMSVKGKLFRTFKIIKTN
ncbi:MAG: T9SS type A sorting domain-containing protein [Bacteroidota bacterium]